MGFRARSVGCARIRKGAWWNEHTAASFCFRSTRTRVIFSARDVAWQGSRAQLEIAKVHSGGGIHVIAPMLYDSCTRVSRSAGGRGVCG